MARRRKRKVDTAYIEAAEKAINDYSKTVNFTIVEYSFEFIVDKLAKNRYFIPDYQREFRWTLEKRSKFIESLLMGLPIPFVFFWQSSDGRMEIVDGSQRLRTVQQFMSGDLKLKGLEVLKEANGLSYSDFSEPLQLKFADKAIRVIILDNSTDAYTRTEMFARINTGGTQANEAEIRRGSLPGPFMDLVIELAESELFKELTPISSKKLKEREREELVTRFFAYLESYTPSSNGLDWDIPNYKENPKAFLFDFAKKTNEKITKEIDEHGASDTKERLVLEFNRMLSFVKNASPFGFTKSATGKQVPRVRFEAIAIGTALALREKPSLTDSISDITPVLESDDFAKATTSDAANVKSSLLFRTSLLKTWLLEQ